MQPLDEHASTPSVVDAASPWRDSLPALKRAQGPGVSLLGYRLIAMPAFPAALDGASLLEDEHLIERAILIIAPAVHGSGQSYAPRPYIPMLAIPQGMAEPDVIADVYHLGRHMTTLHFSAIWNRAQRDGRPRAWERVSFQHLDEARRYFRDLPCTRDALSLCPTCSHFHAGACLSTEPTSLSDALGVTGLALCLHRGTVYLVAWNPLAPAGQWPGSIYWHLVSRAGGLDACPAPYTFADLASGSHFLRMRNILLESGWIATDAVRTF